MRVFVRCLFVLVVCLGSWAFGLTRQAAMRAQGVGYGFDYLLYLPKEYDADTRVRWPLLVFLHGAGETGTNVARVAVNGPPAEIEKGRDFPAVVISPQAPVYNWDPVALEAFIDDLSHQYRVDRSRICVTGLSMGGIGTWGLAVRHPERYAAVAPLCGYGDTSQAANMRALPVWAFHGMLDGTISYTYSTSMIEAVRQGGGDPRLTLYPSVGHDVWVPVYAGTEIYDWLFAQRRGHPVPQLQAEPGSGVQFHAETLPPLTGSYRWEVMGASGFEQIVNGRLAAWGDTQASGATSAVLELSKVSESLAGRQVRCTAVGASTTSTVHFRLHVGQLPQLSVLGAMPGGMQPAGTSVELKIENPEAGVSYQWYLNQEPLAGAIGTQLNLVVGVADAGLYAVSATNVAGMQRSLELGILQVQSAATLSNLSARAYVQTGDKALVAGFATSGAEATAEKSMLIRGIGPALSQPGFGVAGALGSTQLRLFDASSTLITSNAAWDAGLVSVFGQLGAFGLPAGSGDSALLRSLKVGRYTAQVEPADGKAGVGMVELYDADVGTPAVRLSNLSARAQVEAGERVLVCGFVVVGKESATVLLRGVGPSLARYGISAPLARPVLTVFDQEGRVIASNSGWQNGVSRGASPVSAGVMPATDALMDSVGAFFFRLGSADCGLVMTLPPGLYTAQVGGGGGSSGVGLAELYELR